MILSIDPGATGAIALLDKSGVLAVWDMPVTAKTYGKGREVNAALLRLIFEEVLKHDPAPTVVIERVGAMPGQGVTSMFSFGRSLGVLEGVVAGLCLSAVFVTPQKWKKHFSLIGKDKDAARTLAIQLFPSVSEKLKRKKDIGRADAILIGAYAEKQYREAGKQCQET